MSRLTFSIEGVRAEPYAAAPTLLFRLRITETSGEQIHALVLRCQIQIDSRRRRYAPAEEERLLELFGEPQRWGETLRTVLWTHVALMVPGFRGSTEIDVPVACTYDFEVAAAKYFHALDAGEVPLLFLFSGMVFTKGQAGVSVEQIPWESEAVCRFPVHVWRELMNRYFPDSAWIRLRVEHFNQLHRFKGQHALPTWDDAIAALLKAAGEEEHA